MALQCPDCGTTIPAENINMQKTLALCSRCNLVFDFGDTNLAARKRKAKPRTRPNRLQMTEDESRLEMSYSRVFGDGAKYSVTALTIGAVLLPLLAVIASADGAPWGVAAFIGVIAAFLWYLVAVSFLTTTKLTLDDNALEVHSGPLPFFGLDNSTVSTHDIKNIYVEDTVEVGMAGVPAHHVTADLYDGNRVKLLSSLPRNYAVYIAAALNASLQAAEDASMAADNLATEPDPGLELTDSEFLLAQEEQPASTVRQH